LYDIHGRRVFSQYMGDSNQFDIGEMGLSKGMYIAELIHNELSQTFKIYKD